jgi:hypothetical protein
MKKIVVTAISLLLLSTATAASSLAVASAAYTCGKDSSGKAIETSIDFTMGGAFSKLCDGAGASPINALLLWAISIMSIGVGIAVVIGIILGGIAYAMSDGDAGKAKEGQEMIGNAIIGLFLFIFLYAGANFLIPGGLFK